MPEKLINFRGGFPALRKVRPGPGRLPFHTPIYSRTLPTLSTLSEQPGNGTVGLDQAELFRVVTMPGEDVLDLARKLR